jgi:hypothetical protein
MEDFSPVSFTIIELIYPIILALIFALIFATAIAFGAAVFFRKVATFFSEFLVTLRDYFPVSVPVALIGYSVGFLTGISRSPAVGTVIPAVLAIIGGLSVYAFGSDNKYKFVVGYSVSLLVVSLFYGVENGSSERESSRENRLINNFQLEHRLRKYRKSADLPEQSPNWLLPGEAGDK